MDPSEHEQTHMVREPETYLNSPILLCCGVLLMKSVFAAKTAKT
jgi:hypothetical protein